WAMSTASHPSPPVVRLQIPQFGSAERETGLLLRRDGDGVFQVADNVAVYSTTGARLPKRVAVRVLYRDACRLTTRGRNPGTAGGPALLDCSADTASACCSC